MIGADTQSAKELTLSILKELVGSVPLRKVHFRFWDGSCWPESTHAPGGARIVFNHPGALRQMLLKNSELALAEAYLAGDFDVEGDLEAAFEFGDLLSRQTQGWSKKLKTAHKLLHLSAKRDANEQLRRGLDLRSKPHSLDRDRAAIQFHYDLSNEFYGLWLDPARVYSCAYFQTEDDDLSKAQVQKMDLICRKLGLRPGDRLLDIGCGWGGLILHAAAHYGVQATGITLSERQAKYAQERVRQLGFQDRVEVRLQDYREAGKSEEWPKYDAISSIGMVEHVGRKNLPLYFQSVLRLLKPGGLFLNHGIGDVALGGGPDADSFVEKHVFPDGDLLPIGEMNRLAQAAGFEIRDVENLRSHYVLTLRHWVRRLESRHEEALRYVSEPIYRTWRLYMAGSAHRFKTGQIAVYQTVLAKLEAGAEGRLPLNRAAWYGGFEPRRNFSFN